MIALLILVPFFSVIFLNLPLGRFNRRLALGIASALFLLQMILTLFPGSGFWTLNSLTFSNIFRFNLNADSLSLVVLFCIGLVAFVSLLTAGAFFKDDHYKFNFINILLIAVAGMNGVALSRDVFSLYVFLEITAVASFILIAFDKDAFGFEGAFKYIILSGVATVMMIAGIALLLLAAGSTNFSVIHSALAGQDKNILISLAIGSFTCALFIKSGLIPFHGWLPDAYTSAPAAVSVFLAGIVTKVAGVYCLIRVVVSMLGFTPGLKSVLLFIGALSAVLGAVAALSQNDFKRMLSYSSISQIGYIILGLGCGTVLGLAGAALHIFNHAVFKSLLFVNSAAVEKQTGSREMEKMGGLAQNMPVTGVSSVLASLSCAGIPPLAGFWSKLIIIIGLWLAGYRAYAVIAILASTLTLAYFLSWQRKVFFGKLVDGFNSVREAGFSLAFPALFLSVLILAAGLFFPFILNQFIAGFIPVMLPAGG